MHPLAYLVNLLSKHLQAMFAWFQHTDCALGNVPTWGQMKTSSTRRHSQRLRKCQCRSGLARCGWAGCCASVCGNLEGMTQLSSTMARAATELCDHQLHNHCHKNKKECSSKQSLHCTRNKTMLNHAGRSNPFYPNLCRVAIQGYIAPFIKWPRQLLWIWILLCP